MARQRRRIFQLGGMLVLAAAVVVVIVLATGGSDDPPAKQAGESIAGERETSALFVHLFYVNQGTENSGYVTDGFLRAIGGGVAGLDVEQAFAGRADAGFQPALDEARQQGQQLFGPQPGTPAFAVGPSGETPTALPSGATADDISAAIEQAS